MGIENLMANDLVYYNEKPVMLKDLWQDFLQNLQTKDDENHQDKHVVWDFGGDKISPIEITEDILFKSNFKKATTYYKEEFYYAKEDSEYYYNIEIYYRPKRNLWNIHAERFNNVDYDRYSPKEFYGHIKYIHELQLILTVLEIDKKIIV